MAEYSPYPFQSDPIPKGPGAIHSDHDEPLYSFRSIETLMSHFCQWLPEPIALAVIEAEKQVFVVRREVSLEETRLQFLKKCENALTRATLEIQSGPSQDWGAGMTRGH